MNLTAHLKSIWPLYLVVIVALFAATKGHHWNSHPCDSPIEYHVGEIDGRFALSKERAAEALARAAAVWNSAAKKKLFSSSQDSDLPVNFVFSDQQMNNRARQAVVASVEDLRSQTGQLEANLNQLKQDYSAKKQNLDADISAFRLRKASYNGRVARLNGNGGGSQSEIQPLEMEKGDLVRQQQALEYRVSELNTMRENLNGLAAQYNFRINGVRRDVSAINADAGRKFIAGEYANRDGSQQIIIYEYGSFSDLVAILTHELGHALGLAHNNNPKSVMSPSSEQQDRESSGTDGPATPSLSADDMRDLRARCVLQ
jgi:SAM-dependent methyltransferase